MELKTKERTFGGKKHSTLGRKCYLKLVISVPKNSFSLCTICTAGWVNFLIFFLTYCEPDPLNHNHKRFSFITVIKCRKIDFLVLGFFSHAFEQNWVLEILIMAGYDLLYSFFTRARQKNKEEIVSKDYYL